MDPILLTFIVPFYNTERYISKCLESLIDQNIPESKYEILCIDDCSQDNSREIILKYKEKKQNITLIEHKVSLKAGGARNTGLRNSRGRYIWFIDSDDWIVPNCLEKLLNICFKNELDVLSFNFARADDNGTILKEGISYKDTKVTDGITFVNQNFGNNFVNHLGYVWQNIYYRDFLFDNDILFPENVYWEDTVFPPKAILLSNRVCSVRDIIYYYRFNTNSYSNKFNKLFQGDLIFQRSFNAGSELYALSQKIAKRDSEISEILRRKSIWFYNSFARFVILSPLKEKLNFYNILYQNRDFVKEKIKQVSIFTRMLATPYLGFCCSIVIKPLYIMKKKLQG